MLQINTHLKTDFKKNIDVTVYSPIKTRFENESVFRKFCYRLYIISYLIII